MKETRKRKIKDVKTTLDIAKERNADPFYISKLKYELKYLRKLVKEDIS